MPTLLVACEESQRVCTAFRERGWEAYSCDLQDCSGGHPEWHIQGDCLEILNGGWFMTRDGSGHVVDKWDLIIAHPPCTFVSNAGACRLYPKKGEIDYKRLSDGLRGKEFFMRFYLYGLYGCGKIAIENPLPSKVFDYPLHSQTIQPYEYGDPYSKRTLLWTFGVPPLTPTMICQEHKTWLPSNTSSFAKGKGGSKGATRGSKNYAKTFLGIAKAMADQWGPFVENGLEIPF